MISIDKKIAGTTLKESNNSYETTFLFDGNSAMFFIVPFSGSSKPIADIPLDVKVEEIAPALERLFSKGYLEKTIGVSGEACYFKTTPLLRHRFAFWLDSFAKKFWYGFATGFAVAVAAGLLLRLI